MTQTLLEMTKDLTRTLVETGQLSAEDMQPSLQSTYATLATLKAQEESGTTASMPDAETPPMDWRKSITRHAVTCLACGETYKQLSILHLRMHGLDTRSYRTQFGIPQSQPLAARTTTERRRQVVQKTRPWEKAPTYRKRQARKGHPSPEPEAEAVHEEAEEPSATVPAQPKRQQKTTQKKQPARKRTSQG